MVAKVLLPGNCKTQTGEVDAYCLMRGIVISNNLSFSKGNALIAMGSGWSKFRQRVSHAASGQPGCKTVRAGCTTLFVTP